MHVLTLRSQLNDQVRQGADGRYYIVSCTNFIGDGGGFLTAYAVPDSTSIGACLAVCTNWNLDPTRSGNQCAFGTLEPRVGNNPSSCYLYRNPLYIEGRDSGATDGDRGFPSYILTTNATLIAGACAISGGVSATSWTSTSTSQSSSSSQTASSTSSSLLPV